MQEFHTGRGRKEPLDVVLERHGRQEQDQRSQPFTARFDEPLQDLTNERIFDIYLLAQSLFDTAEVDLHSRQNLGEIQWFPTHHFGHERCTWGLARGSVTPPDYTGTPPTGQSAAGRFCWPGRPARRLQHGLAPRW